MTEMLLKTRVVASAFDVTCPTIRRWRRAGKLVAVQVGRELRYRRSDIERLLGEPLRERTSGRVTE